MQKLLYRFWNSPHLLLVLSTLFWGGNAVAGKHLADYVPPVTISMVRLAISSLLLVPWVYPFLKQDWHRAKGNVRHLFVLAVTGVLGFNLLSYWALQFTTAINVALFNSTMPLFIVVLSYFILKEKLTGSLLFSIFISLIGILCVISKGSLERLMAFQFNIGDLLMLAAVLLWAVYTVGMKKISEEMNPLSVFGYSSILAFLLTVPASMVELRIHPVGSLGYSEWTSLLYLGIFPSLCSFLMWNRAIELVGPSKSSVYMNLTPVFGALLAYIFLREVLTTVQIFGGLLVFTGVFAASRGQRKLLMEKAESI
ncbi:DMT family transporter [Bacillaceae bacterium]